MERKAIRMKQFSIYHIPALSFFSKALYRDMGLRWKGTAFGYLLALLAICWIPTMVKLQHGLAEFVRTTAPKIVSQIPRLDLVHGVVSTEEPRPYFIQDPATGKNVAIIDTTGSISSLTGTDADFLVIQKKIIYRVSPVDTRNIDLGQIEKFSLDQAKINGWLSLMAAYLALAVYPFMVLGSYLFRIVQALVYAAIGLLLAFLCKGQISYLALIRLAVVAVTPSIIVRTLIGITQIQVPYAGLLFFALAMAYLFFGVKAVFEDDRENCG
jgi:hypothetical protein